jgi:tetratricopeptide (TPR) repeat protein
VGQGRYPALPVPESPVAAPQSFRSYEAVRAAEAIPHLRKVLELEPKNTEARLELGRDLYDTGNVTDALNETTQILIENPKNVDALYNVGAIYANSSKPDAAREYWTRAVASDPNSDSGKRAAESLSRLGGSQK